MGLPTLFCILKSRLARVKRMCRIEDSQCADVQLHRKIYANYINLSPILIKVCYNNITQRNCAQFISNVKKEDVRMKGRFLKTGISMLLASAMMITSVPASPVSAAEPAEKATPILDSAIVTYDFDDWSVKEGDDKKLVNGDKEIVLEAFGDCKEPELKENTARGKVLNLFEQGVADNGVDNRGDALLPENPFAGKSIDNGFTLSFWTKTTGTVGGNRTLVDFEVAPATTGRAGTLALSQSMLWWNITDQKANTFTDFNIGDLKLQKENGWKMVTMALTKTGINFYSDGQKVTPSLNGTPDYEEIVKELAGTSDICDDPAKTKVRLGASMAKYWIGAGAWIDDVSFFDKALSDEEVVSLYEETKIEAQPVSGVIIKGSNKVNEGNSIQLTAQMIPEDASDIAGKSITWEVENPDVLAVSSSGKVTTKTPGKTTVTAKIKDTEIVSDPFEIEVIGAQESLESGKHYLTVYSTTKAFYASTGNLEQETRSVYMAVSNDGKKFEVLNNGGGVIFAKKGAKQLTVPMVYKNEGKFTVVAEDASSSKLHIFTSADGVHYYDENMADSYGETAPTLKKDNFELLLKGENILKTDSSITLGNAVELTEAEYKYIVDKLGNVVNTGLETVADVTVNAGDNVLDILKTQRPSVNATYTDGSTQKFNINWNDALSGKDLSKPGVYELTGKVEQTKYLNKLKEINGSKLEEDNPENVNPDQPDHYDEATGKVYFDETKFVEGMADPMIYWDEITGYYYMTGSYFPEDADADKLPGDTTKEYDRVVLRRGRTLEELQNRKNQVTIWKAGNQGYEANDGAQKNDGQRFIWAPEIHRIGDKWVVYFTEAHGSTWLIYCHALVLDGSKDPYETALKAYDQESEWKDYQMRTDKGGVTGAITKDFCLDMTYFKDAVNGQSYVSWASKASGLSDIYIAKVNENEPWKIDSDIVLLTAPEYGWECVRYVVNEGPTVLQKDGNIFVCYSASGTGSEYAIGMMSAKAGTDLLDIKNNWTKSPYPLLTSRDVSGEEGPGHNSFTVDKDGNAIFVYHARPTSHNYKKCTWDGTASKYNDDPLLDPCRHARLKRVHWAKDGTPILKMTYDDELTAANQTVKVKVTVKEKPVTPPPAVPGVNSLKLNVKKLTLGVKEKYTLKATVLPKAAAKVSYVSNKPSIVSVGTTNGKLTAKKTGKAVITATAGDKTAKVTVTVKKAPDKKAKVTLKKKNVSMKLKGKNKTYQISPKVSSKYGSATFKYTIDKKGKKVVKVDANGKVTAKKKGKATITIKTYNGKAKTTLKITVK